MTQELDAGINTTCNLKSLAGVCQTDTDITARGLKQNIPRDSGIDTTAGIKIEIPSVIIARPGRGSASGHDIKIVAVSINIRWDFYIPGCTVTQVNISGYFQFGIGAGCSNADSIISCIN